jgi:SAM-dependent methyltransferase
MTGKPPMDANDDAAYAAGCEQLRGYWDHRAQNSQTDCERVEWSRRAQCMRFEAFVIEHDLRGKSVLDVGCGVGDFWQHLHKRGLDCEYLGVDLSSEMIRRARERFPGVAFQCCDLLTWQPEKPFDYAVAFGIHNIRVDGGRQVLQALTPRQFELCRTAAHVSLLTDRYEGFAPHIQAWRAEEVLTMALGITPYVVLRHDYLPNDFSVTLYRRPLIDTRHDLILE